MNFIVKNAENIHLKEIREIADSVFGKNYLTPCTKNTIVVILNEIVCGFAYYELNKEVGILKTIAVKKDCQKKGIGSLLLIEVEKRLSDVKKILVPTWKDDEGINLEKLLIKYGYRKTIEVIDFWKKDCDDKKFLCVSRKNECICSSLIFEKEFF